MKRTSGRKGRYRAIVSAAVLATSLSGASVAVQAVPSIETRAHPGIEACRRVIETLAPAPDEFVLMYVRPDAEYARWTLWAWPPGGSGRRVEFTGMRDGIAYLKGRIADFADPASPRLNFIVRTDNWEKDPGVDQSWHFGAGRAAVVFSGDAGVYPATPGPPRIIEATPEELAAGLFGVRIRLSDRLIVPDGEKTGFRLSGGLGVADEKPLAGGEEYLLTVSGRLNARRTATLSHPLFDNAVSIRFPAEPPLVRPLTAAQRARLPEPVLGDHPDWVRLYWACWAFMKEKLTRGNIELGFAPLYIDEGFNENIYQWDSCFMALYAMYGPELFPSMAALDNFYNLQRDFDGYICRTYNENSGLATGENDINPPLFAWAEWRYCRLTGDTSRLERILPVLDRYYDWVKRNARSETSRGLYYITDLGCGMDNSPREEFVRRGAWVDLSSQQALAAVCLSRLAALAGRTDLERKYTVEHEALKALINDSLWNEQEGNYHDRTEAGAWHLRKTIASFWPLVAEVASTEQAKSQVENYLRNPDRFYRHHLFPTLSADDPDYDGRGHYWRGGVWAPTNFAVIKGLERFDGAFAHEAAVNHVAAMSRVYDAFRPESYAYPLPTLTEPNIARNGDGRRQVWESYSPDFDAPGTRWDARLLVRQRFCGWSGIGPVALLFENVLGFDANGIEKTLTWRIRLTERHGVRRLKFGGNEVTLIASKRRAGRAFTVTGSCRKKFRLVVYVDDAPISAVDREVAAGSIRFIVR